MASISIWDAGFLFGEGVFTTLRLYNGKPLDLACHWSRLTHQAGELSIPLMVPLPQIQSIVKELAAKNQLEFCDSRLRITITRGGNADQPMPITPNADQEPTILMTISPLPEGFDAEMSSGINVITLGPEFTRHSRPDLKSLNYLSSVLAMREARQQTCSEAIVFDEKGFITEAAMSSVFLCHSSEIFTPPNNGNILDGRTRKSVIHIARENGLSCEEKNLTRADLESASEVFLCNSIREIVPVIIIDDQPVGQQRPGPITVQMRHWYRAALHSA